MYTERTTLAASHSSHSSSSLKHISLSFMFRLPTECLFFSTLAMSPLLMKLSVSVSVFAVFSCPFLLGFFLLFHLHCALYCGQHFIDVGYVLNCCWHRCNYIIAIYVAFYLNNRRWGHANTLLTLLYSHTCYLVMSFVSTILRLHLQMNPSKTETDPPALYGLFQIHTAYLNAVLGHLFPANKLFRCSTGKNSCIDVTVVPTQRGQHNKANNNKIVGFNVA